MSVISISNPTTPNQNGVLSGFLQTTSVTRAHQTHKAESENDGDGDDGVQSASRSSNTGTSSQSGSAALNQLA